MKNLFAWAYGLIAYSMGVTSLTLFILFTLGIALPFTVDIGGVALGVNPWLVNIVLILLFGVQHSVMARASFKNWLQQYIAQPLERSTYLYATSLPLLLIVAFWQPIDGIVWQSTSQASVCVGFTIAALGWALVLASTFFINHFDLFGLRQVYFYTKGLEYKSVSFETPFLYKWVRHPMQLGVLIGVWAIPTMTVSHLLLAIGMTLYIMVGLYFEERDLVRSFGDRYRAYQFNVPKLLPNLFRLKQSEKEKVNY